MNLQEDLDEGCGWTCITGNDTITYSKALSKTYMQYFVFPP